MSPADMSTLTHLFYIANIRTDSQWNSASTYIFFGSRSSQWHTIGHFSRGADSTTTWARRQLKLIKYSSHGTINPWTAKPLTRSSITHCGTVTTLVISRDFSPKLHFNRTTRWETSVRESSPTNMLPSELRGLWASGTNCCCLSYKAIPLSCRGLTAHLCWEFRSPEIMYTLRLSLSALPHTHLSVY